MNAKRLVALKVCRDDCEAFANRLRQAEYRMRESASGPPSEAEIYDACSVAYETAAASLERQVERFRHFLEKESNEQHS